LTACQQVLNRWKAALPEDMQATLIEVQLLACQSRIRDSRAVVERALNSVESQLPGNAVIQTVSTEQQQQLAVRKADVLCQFSLRFLQAKQPAEAVFWAKRALELCPDYDGAHLVLGDYLVEQMSVQSPHTDARRQLAQQAASAYSKVYRRQQGQITSGNKLAFLLATELNDAAEAYRIMLEMRAAKFYSRPMSGDMLSVEVLDTLGAVYAKLAQPNLTQERIQVFEEARRRYDHEPRIALHLAQAYQAAGDSKNAMTHYQIARSLLLQSTLSADIQKAINFDIQQGMNEAQEKTR